MFDFGDDLIIESYRIPWLIWIQLLVMLLLVILLYSLSTSPSDLSIHSAAAIPSTPSPGNRPFLATSTLHHSKQAGENQVNETGTSTSSGVEGARKNESQQREDAGSPMKDASHGLIYGESYHPCNFLGLAKQAFLKCLGLDSPSESPSRRKHGKYD